MEKTDYTLQPLTDRPRAITLRSVALGLFGVLVLSILTPYNDHALHNTMLIGNNIPVGLLLMTFIFAVFINGPLSKFAPRFAFSTGEMAVAFGMTLVACAVPASGVMRYLPASLIAPLWQTSNNLEYHKLLDEIHLPRWLYPTMGEKLDERLVDPVVRGYVYQLLPEEAVPFTKWLIPMATWGTLFLALFIALLCIITLVRRQWVENERLSFPLAQIQLSLVMEPAPRRWFNGVLSQRSFWIGFGIVFFIHTWNGLSEYQPRYFPKIPLNYDLKTIFPIPPWSLSEPKFRLNRIYFTAIGVSYFISSSVNFSLWFFFLLDNVLRVSFEFQNMGQTGDIPGRGDEVIGGSIAFGLGMIWVGRHHWRLILNQAFRGHRPGEPRGRYLPYPFAFWVLVASILVMVVWLRVAGHGWSHDWEHWRQGWLAPCVTVFMVLFASVFVARIVAETGLVFASTYLEVARPWYYLGLGGVTQPISVQEYYLVSLVQMQNSDVRECLSVYGTHATRVADETVFQSGDMRKDSSSDRSTGRWFIALLLLSLVVAYIASGASMLWVEYRFGLTKEEPGAVPNNWVMENATKKEVMEPTRKYEKEQFATPYNVPAHLSLGFVATAFLSIMRWRFTWWALHPIGFIMRGSRPVADFWISIFIAWLIKTVVLRFGGARLYQSSKPFFLGLIIGESVSAGFWLVVAICLSAMGIPYKAFSILPGN